MEKDDVTWCDVTCSLNFQKYFLMEKDNIAWNDVIYLHVKIIEFNDIAQVYLSQVSFHILSVDITIFFVNDTFYLRPVTMKDQGYIRKSPLREIVAATPTNQVSATHELYAWWLICDVMWCELTLWWIWWLCDEYHDFTMNLMTLW
jgi:hypothetical protein